MPSYGFQCSVGLFLAPGELNDPLRKRVHIVLASKREDVFDLLALQTNFAPPRKLISKENVRDPGRFRCRRYPLEKNFSTLANARLRVTWDFMKSIQLCPKRSQTPERFWSKKLVDDSR